tara:strand:+ start:510 stop:632 length:123 start_codon:yes stop_codon:yes gene_type:complete
MKWLKYEKKIPDDAVAHILAVAFSLFLILIGLVVTRCPLQ